MFRGTDKNSIRVFDQREVLVPKKRDENNMDAERSNWSVKNKGQIQLKANRAFIIKKKDLLSLSAQTKLMNVSKKRASSSPYLKVFPCDAKLRAISATNFLSFVGAPTMAVSARIRADKMSNLDCVYFLSRIAKA